MIKDFNRNELKPGEVFHFKNSLRPFIWVENDESYCGGYFIDINEFIAYSYDDLRQNGNELRFYEKEEDEDFAGVEVDGKVEWVE